MGRLRASDNRPGAPPLRHLPLPSLQWLHGIVSSSTTHVPSFTSSLCSLRPTNGRTPLHQTDLQANAVELLLFRTQAEALTRVHLPADLHLLDFGM